MTKIEHKDLNSFDIKVILIILLLIVYSLIFFIALQFHIVDVGFGTFSLIPVILMGYWFGWKGGSIGGVLAFLINSSIVLVARLDINSVISNASIFGSFAVIFIGIIVGYIQDLAIQSRKTNKELIYKEKIIRTVGQITEFFAEHPIVNSEDLTSIFKIVGNVIGASDIVITKLNQDAKKFEIFGKWSLEDTKDFFNLDDIENLLNEKLQKETEDLLHKDQINYESDGFSYIIFPLDISIENAYGVWGYTIARKPAESRWEADEIESIKTISRVFSKSYLTQVATGGLTVKNKQVSDLSGFMVDRELKMADLKKENEVLKKKIQELSE